MPNYLKHLEREGDVPTATLSWLGALEERSLFVRVDAMTNLLNFGEDNNFIKEVIAPGYESPQELTKQLKHEGYPFDCRPLLQQQQYFGETSLQGEHLDHDRTLCELRTRGIVFAQSLLEESIQYLQHLKSKGVLFGAKEWKSVLARDHLELLSNPENEVELHAATGREMVRCKPGWSDIHPHYSLYKIGGAWNDSPVLRNKIEKYHDSGKFYFSDGICDKC